jgi:hypothetical protein
MADYYPLIAKAVSGLEKSTGEARRALYDRARNALLAQLRGVEPALSEQEITRERLALEEAVRKVEAEAARRSRSDPPPPARQDPLRPEAAKAEPAPESLRPDTAQSAAKEMPLRPARQATIPSMSGRVSGGEARVPPTIRQAAPLSAAAVRPILPTLEADQTVGVPRPAGASADSNAAQRDRSRRIIAGSSISDKGLKGLHDMSGEASAAGATAAAPQPQSIPEPDMARRREPRVEGRPDRRADLGTAGRPDARAETRTDARGAGRGESWPDMRGDPRPDARNEPRTGVSGDGRADPRGGSRPRVQTEPPTAGEVRPEQRVGPGGEGARGMPRAEVPAEPRIEPEPVRAMPLRPLPRETQRFIEREPVAEPTREPRRTRDERSSRPLAPPPLDEPEAGTAASESPRSEYPARPPTSMVRQEDVRSRAVAASRAVKSERGSASAQQAKLPRQWKRLAALVIMALLLAAAAAIGLWKASELLSLFRGVPSRVVDTVAPGDAGKSKITDRIGSPSTASQSAVEGAPVAQKVVLYEEDQSDPAGKRYVGSAVWRTDRVAPAPGQPAQIAIRADIDIPEQKIGMRWSLRRNDDKALPASHTVEIMFTLPADFPHGGISNIPGVLMKQGESTRGVPLVGLAVKVTNNFFLVGLSSVDADMQQNLRLLKERSWFDIPVVYGDGKRAIIAIEKGTPGERAFADAFAAWGQ